MTNLKHR